MKAIYLVKIKSANSQWNQCDAYWQLEDAEDFKAAWIIDMDESCYGSHAQDIKIQTIYPRQLRYNSNFEQKGGDIDGLCC